MKDMVYGAAGCIDSIETLKHKITAAMKAQKRICWVSGQWMYQRASQHQNCTC